MPSQAQRPTAPPQHPTAPPQCTTAIPQHPTASPEHPTASPQRPHSVPTAHHGGPRASYSACIASLQQPTAPQQRAHKASNLSIQRPPDAQQQYIYIYIYIPLCVLRLSVLSTVCVSSKFVDHWLQTHLKPVFVWHSHPLERWLYCKGLQAVSLPLSLDETL